MTRPPQPGVTEVSILTQLERLRALGALARSQCRGSLLQTLRPLLDAGVVVDERSGAGRRIVVRDRIALAEFIRREFPDLHTPPGTPSRVAGVARFRNSKSFPADTPEIVCVRVWRDTALLLDGQPVDAARSTERHGVFAFLLDAGGRHALAGSCALIENPALFATVERLSLPIDLAILGNGRVSQRLVDWLAAQTAVGFSLLHLPDYDPSGMAEFLRLHERLGARLRLHLPPDLDRRFERFANRALLDKPNSRALLNRLREIEVPGVRQVLSLIDRHNAGLEQEALLLDS
jgi:hypothetical protein